MKKIYFFNFLILFQSCFTYRDITYNNLKNGEKVIIKIEKQDRTKIKGQIISINDEVIILKSKGNLKSISLDEIFGVQKRNFSLFKTGSVFTGILLLVVLFGLV